MLLVKRLESQLIPKPLRASTGFQYEFLLLNVLSVQIQIISLSTRFPKIPNSAFDDIKLLVVVLGAAFDDIKLPVVVLGHHLMA
jgi:hypothetical protein